MVLSRLTLALEGGEVSLPEAGRIAVFAPQRAFDLSALPGERLNVVTGQKPDFDYFAGLGYECAVAPEGRYAAAIMCVPRAKPLARALVAEAAAVTDGVVIVDGAKTDGVESLLKDIRRRVPVSAPFSKAHGKVFAFEASAEFQEWRATPSKTAGGWVTAPGVFSADAVDPASEMLGDALPARLGAQVADLGAGWGYLSRAVLDREGIDALHLVEADHSALTCARQNLQDARAQFHWADALTWQPPALMDAVVMNPPFHTGRTADPGLGRCFIAAAARMLKPSGHLWMVANRHLPYEPSIEAHFAKLEEVAGDTRFKILHAARPARTRR